MNYDYCLIGGGIASASAAEAIRNRDPKGTIAVFGDEPHPLYSRVLLPHVVRGKILEDKAILKKPEVFSAQNIEYHSGVRVTAVDTHNKMLTLADGKQVGYGRLLIATGGSVRKLEISGADDANIAYFQTLDDARALRDIKPSGSAIVFGGGFIALELLMSFIEKGVAATVVMRGSGFFHRILDAESQKRISAVIENRRVKSIFGTEVKTISKQEDKYHVALGNGETVIVEHLAAGLGLLPNTNFLSGSGIAIETGILTNNRLETSATDVYAAGDVAEFDDHRVGAKRVVGNWQNALFQGKIAGAIMAGDEAVVYDQVTAYSISCFGLPITFLGAVEVPADSKIVRITDISVTQFIIKHHKVIGITCVGACKDRAGLMGLLQKNEELTEEQIAAL